MKPYAALATLALCPLALAACSEPAETTDVAEVTDAPAEAIDVPLAVDGLPIAGDYLITAPDGETQNVTLTADGKATYTDGEGNEYTGSYTGGTADQPYCVTMEGETEPYCSAQSMEEGVWTATSVDEPENSVTITRLTD